ncbi:hypothetical protein [Paenibacillus riograndensis]|nr:hypothetical protein [Paenibacillus riograndensis]
MALKRREGSPKALHRKAFRRKTGNPQSKLSADSAANSDRKPRHSS